MSTAGSDSECPTAAPASAAVTRLKLTNFRNYPELDLSLDARPVCLFGPNGSGKTNLVEAVSFLGPGRGLRAAGKPNGTTPYGCVTAGGQLVDGRRVGQRLYRDPATWPARERIVQLRAEGLSFAAIRAELSRLRVPSPTGEPAWGKSSIKLVCDTHLGLNHIPPLPAPHETAVSEAAHA